MKSWSGEWYASIYRTFYIIGKGNITLKTASKPPYMHGPTVYGCVPIFSAEYIQIYNQSFQKSANIYLVFERYIRLTEDIFSSRPSRHGKPESFHAPFILGNGVLTFNFRLVGGGHEHAFVSRGFF